MPNKKHLKPQKEQLKLFFSWVLKACGRFLEFVVSRSL